MLNNEQGKLDLIRKLLKRAANSITSVIMCSKCENPEENELNIEEILPFVKKKSSSEIVIFEKPKKTLNSLDQKKVETKENINTGLDVECGQRSYLKETNLMDGRGSLNTSHFNPFHVNSPVRETDNQESIKNVLVPQIDFETYEGLDGNNNRVAFLRSIHDEHETLKEL